MIDGASRDCELAAKIPGIVKVSQPGRPKRISMIEITRESGIPFHNLLKRLPRPNEVIRKHVETAEAFAVRRVRACRELREHGVGFPWWKVKDKASIGKQGRQEAHRIWQEYRHGLGSNTSTDVNSPPLN